ncbi:unnamed protein product [Spirodela intermedia]|uniref:Uncharacterized protein n=1 Tax=Spirodela intermedia TaxID=51605 RepID=A0A7I8JRW3_SPIIN|nr:unnamed protein product [Spirodela intermedia]CAA6672162.1 unnamed protein product [Spirodela intermedia]
MSYCIYCSRGVSHEQGLGQLGLGPTRHAYATPLPHHRWPAGEPLRPWTLHDDSPERSGFQCIADASPSRRWNSILLLSI